MWDVFISHASEDKTEVVEPLAAILKQRGLSVWYDNTALTLGDSLRRKIDEGLAGSRFGIVILSRWFFNKNWSQRELDALFAKEVHGTKVVLPVWHQLEHNDILSYSPMMADRVGVSTRSGQWRAGFHIDRFRAFAEGHLEIDGEDVLDVQRDVRLDQFFEAGLFDFDSVGAGGQVRQVIFALTVAQCVVTQVCAVADGGDSGFGDEGLGGIANPACEGRICGLGAEKRRRREEQQSDKKSSGHGWVRGLHDRVLGQSYCESALFLASNVRKRCKYLFRGI